MTLQHPVCDECGKISRIVPTGWFSVKSREERLRRWSDLCPSCGNPNAATRQEPLRQAHAASAPNPKLDMANLEAQWAYASTHRERSDLEAAMWNLVLDTLPKKERKEGSATWLSRRLQVSEKQTRGRLMLRLSEPATNVLWDRVDGSERMLLHSAAEVVRRAKLRAVSERSTLAEAIERELAVYDTWILMRTSEGTFRKSPQRVRGSKGDIHARTVVDVATARDLWASFRASAKRVVDHELERVASKHKRDQLRDQVLVEIERDIQMLQSRIRRVRDAELHNGDGPLVPIVAAGESVNEACGVLGVDPPDAGQIIDHGLYKSAKKNFKRLVRENHPDQGGARERYETIVQAMQVIEDVYQARDQATSNKG